MIIYLIINDIHSIYFPYFRLFLNYLLVDEEMVREIPITQFIIMHNLVNH